MFCLRYLSGRIAASPVRIRHVRTAGSCGNLMRGVSPVWEDSTERQEPKRPSCIHNSSWMLDEYISSIPRSSFIHLYPWRSRHYYYPLLSSQSICLKGFPKHNRVFDSITERAIGCWDTTQQRRANLSTTVQPPPNIDQIRPSTTTRPLDHLIILLDLAGRTPKSFKRTQTATKKSRTTIKVNKTGKKKIKTRKDKRELVDRSRIPLASSN